MPLHRLLLVACVLSLATAASSQDARAVVAEASRAMGVTDATSVTLTGTAAYGNFGQSRTLSFGLASTSIRNYVRTFDFAAGISHATGVGVPPGAPNGVPPGPFDDLITPASPGIRQLEVWTTPWGFLRGAAAAPQLALKSQNVDGVSYRVVTWTPPFTASSGRPYRIAGYISPALLVDKVETWIDHPLMGDLQVMFSYSDYRDAAGLKFPSRVSQKNIGMEVYVAAFTVAQANPPSLAALLQQAQPPPADAAAPSLTPERLADGVYRLAGGYDALAVELKDMAVILGGGGSEARGLALITETRRLFPGKRIRYAVNMHGHFDHAMVLPAFASEGITILTDDPNRYFLQESLNIPRTLVGDVLARSKKKARVEGVIEKLVLGDATRRIELHHLKQVPHADGMLAAWLPQERILFVSDIEPPVAGQAASPSLLALLQNIDRLGLDFETFIANGREASPPMSKEDFVARLADQGRR